MLLSVNLMLIGSKVASAVANQLFLWFWQENLLSDKGRKKNTPLEHEVI